VSLGLLAVALASVTPAQASTGRQFVTLRRTAHCDRKLTYATVQTNAANFVGRVIELRGTVGGKAETGTGVTVMLNMADHNAPILDVPNSEVGVLNSSLTPQVRVLAQIGEGGSGNVVPLKVLAVADENEVAVIDLSEEARERAIAEAEARQRQQMAQQMARAQARGVALASRGGLNRGTPQVSGDAMTQANVYVPLLNERVKQCFVPYFDFIANHNRKLDSKTVGQITYHLLRYAEATNIDPRLVVAMIVAESDFDPGSTSHAGAMGLGQLMPEEAHTLGLNNPYDVEQNLYGSIVCLRQHLDRFADPTAPGGGMSMDQIRLALAAYNAGPGAVKKYKGIPPYRETQNYVRRIEKLYRQLCQQ
jgi:soluble lytic murein transglycosylase-like protein